MKLIKEIGFFLFLIGLGIASRLIPHPWNFTAIGSMALFSGFSFRSNKSLVFLPFVSLIISDYFVGFYNGMIYVYAGFALNVGLSLVYFSKSESLSFLNRLLTVGCLSVISSFLFFLLTNYGVWSGSMIYAPTAAGLVQSYFAGLPFLFNQMAGDLFYTSILFSVYEYLTWPAKAQLTIG